MKSAVLDHIYRVYDKYAAQGQNACKRGCSRCCTRNVTLTGLEALRIAEYLLAEGKAGKMASVRASAGKKRFQPALTTNGIAEICMRGEDYPEETIDPAWTTCPLLEDGECTVYPVRPFGCRCMFSTRNCDETGYADMSEFTATLNDVFMQYIEHIDLDGCFGNLTDMLLFLEDEENIRAYPMSLQKKWPEKLIPNHPLKGLMVPPEYRERIRPILQVLERGPDTVPERLKKH